MDIVVLKTEKLADNVRQRPRMARFMPRASDLLQNNPASRMLVQFKLPALPQLFGRFAVELSDGRLLSWSAYTQLWSTDGLPIKTLERHEGFVDGAWMSG